MYTFTDEKFMTAAEKHTVLKAWERFLKGGCKRSQFTKALYNHLIQHCSFIAHCNIDGFYGTYFDRPSTFCDFLSQFDNRGPCKSVEYGWNWWLTSGTGCDLNQAMIEVASEYIPGLIRKAQMDEMVQDVALAHKLLKKHGLLEGE